MEDGGTAMASCANDHNPPRKITNAALSKTLAEFQPRPSQVASCALNLYRGKLPKKGKPKPGEEWTVYAAIVAFHRVDNRMWVVSCATGTKCTAQRHNECVLHDSHAEVLTRRGLIRVILSEIMEKKKGIENNEKKKNTDSRSLLVVSKGYHSDSEERQYRFNPNIDLHFYISDSPCGDASIYSVPCDDATRNNDGILYTGAKVIVSEATKVDATDCGGNHQLLSTKGTNASNKVMSEVARNEKDLNDISEKAGPVFAREAIQVLGKLRIKSGRSNLPAHMRSHSHSCSDKLASWSVLGLQGGLLTKFLDPPIVPLASVVVSRDSRLSGNDGDFDNGRAERHQSQRMALQRAIPGRVRSVWEHLSIHQEHELPTWKPSIPKVHIVPETFESGKAQMIAPRNSSNFSGKKRKQSNDNGENMISNKTKEIEHGTIGKKAASPCGMSFNWNQNEDIEVTVGVRGVKHGKKPKTPQDIEKHASRLSRARFLREYSFLWESKDLASSASSIPMYCKRYHQFKEENASHEWTDLKNRILTQNGSPLAGWIRYVPANDDDLIDSKGRKADR
ncbi:unnamed protein product [Pseudo-nitzschia multistriata]|uniref:tRNA-specific adenosine deaminase 1 n=1 Tax=Pseudo-nitzschia multistriata TaxID=183589 RepID=A0A448ZKI7_9STRA|nr:unnamed protein product [Pseudo-nitzschia multistriata]